MNFSPPSFYLPLNSITVFKNIYKSWYIIFPHCKVFCTGIWPLNFYFPSHFPPEFFKITSQYFTCWALTLNQFSSVQLLTCVQLFVTPWTAAHQASLSITNSWSLLSLMSIESVMPSNHLILCHSLLLLPSIFLSIRVFSNQSVLASGGQSIGVSASASALPMNIQGWFALGWTG